MRIPKPLSDRFWARIAVCEHGRTCKQLLLALARLDKQSWLWAYVRP